MLELLSLSFTTLVSFVALISTDGMFTSLGAIYIFFGGLKSALLSLRKHGMNLPRASLIPRSTTTR